MLTSGDRGSKLRAHRCGKPRDFGLYGFRSRTRQHTSPLAGFPSVFRYCGSALTFAPPLLRVLTWNLWWRFGDWQRRHESIIRVLQSSAPDIVGLQEVWATSNENQAQTLADMLDMHVAWCPSPAPEHFQRRLGDRSVAVGNAILSRWPITRESKCLLPSGARDAGRTAVFALIAAPARPVPFFTTQLTSAIGQSALRSDQVRALAQFVVDETPERANPLVTGDFNAE